LRIVVNAARNRRRASTRREGLAIRVADAVTDGDAAPSPERAVEVAEERTALLRAVGSLKDEDREVIACRFFLELSVEETATALGCRQGTVKSRLSRALTRLRLAMGTPDG
jgi:RNA polymerase sigma-70 factor (ECF subfamily)